MNLYKYSLDNDFCIKCVKLVVQKEDGLFYLKTLNKGRVKITSEKNLDKITSKLTMYSEKADAAGLFKNKLVVLLKSQCSSYEDKILLLKKYIKKIQKGK